MNLPIFHVEKNTIHGGSVRIYASKQNKVVSDSVSNLVDVELASKIFDIDFLDDFALKVASKRAEIKMLMSELQKKEEKNRCSECSCKRNDISFL